MPIDTSLLPATRALARLRLPGEDRVLALWDGSKLRRLPRTSLALIAGHARDGLGSMLAAPGDEIDPEAAELLAPCDEQEVWASGVTYARSRDARIEEAQEKDAYARVYEAERPELFFKAAAWRVARPGGSAGIRADSTWDVPEPELAALSNARGEIIAWTCANDMSSRSIEGENPLYLPQAKVYDLSASLGPVAVLAEGFDAGDLRVRMQIERGGRLLFEGETRTSQLIRSPAELAAVLHSSYTLPYGAWLMTGTGIVPPPPYTAEAGDVVRISIDGLGTLVNDLVRVHHSGATAPPRR